MGIPTKAPVDLAICGGFLLFSGAFSENHYTWSLTMINRNDKKNKWREQYQKKKVQPKKLMRGQPETKYEEVKKNVSFSLTPTGAALLKKISKQLGISASEFLERIARGEIQIDINLSNCPEFDFKTAEFPSTQNQ